MNISGNTADFLKKANFLQIRYAFLKDLTNFKKKLPTYEISIINNTYSIYIHTYNNTFLFKKTSTETGPRSCEFH
jgi:hypothetical protein